MDRKVRVVVKIAELHNGKAIEPLRPARQEEVVPHDAGLVWLQQDGVPGEHDCARCRG